MQVAWHNHIFVIIHPPNLSFEKKKKRYGMLATFDHPKGIFGVRNKLPSWKVYLSGSIFGSRNFETLSGAGFGQPLPNLR